MKAILSAALLLTPAVASAQGVITYLESVLALIGDIVIPALISLAFLFFMWQAVRYFIFTGANEDAREKARALMLWGIIALVLILILWGIVALLSGATGLDRTQPVCPDYIRRGGKCPGQDDTLIFEPGSIPPGTQEPGDTTSPIPEPILEPDDSFPVDATEEPPIDEPQDSSDWQFWLDRA